MFLTEEFRHLKIPLEDITSATNNFDRNKQIGRGGFGKVYKGELSLPEGKSMVAFKRLDSKFGQGNTEFWKEIMMLSKCKHENLISLLRFCFEGDERILVYEYASRGSLDCHLSDSSLTWIQRLKICVGVARALNYLHDPMETKQRVIHRDIKSSNILLDDKCTAKVSDFGLSKVSPASQPHSYLVSHVVGTFGYCDPLYFETGLLSKESDVYSFGIVLFEVMCGRLCVEYRNGVTIHILVAMWKKCFDDERLDDIIFHDLKKQIDRDSLMTFSAIANRCLNRDHKERPTMVEVVKELEVAFEQQIKAEQQKFLSLKEEKFGLDLLTSMTWNFGNMASTSGSQALHLQFLKGISTPVFTGDCIQGEDCEPIVVALVDGISGKIGSTGAGAAMEVEIVVLEGDSNDDEAKNWTSNDFNNKIISRLNGKNVLRGNTFLNLREGIVSVDKISFSHNSVWKKASNHRLGARAANAVFATSVKEAKTESFQVRDMRYFFFCKSATPSLLDEVWRLRSIPRCGPCIMRLRNANIKTVMDFRTLLAINPKRLEDILDVPPNIWEVITNHAQRCKDKGIYFYHYPKDGQKSNSVFFNTSGQLVGLIAESQFVPSDMLPNDKKADAQELVVSSSEHWDEVGVVCMFK